MCWMSFMRWRNDFLICTQPSLIIFTSYDKMYVKMNDTVLKLGHNTPHAISNWVATKGNADTGEGTDLHPSTNLRQEIRYSANPD